MGKDISAYCIIGVASEYLRPLDITFGGFHTIARQFYAIALGNFISVSWNERKS